MIAGICASYFLLSGCIAPTTADENSRVLKVQNLGPPPIYDILTAPAGTAGNLDRMQDSTDIASGSIRSFDLDDGAGYIAPGSIKSFNLDDGTGACVFDVVAIFADGGLTKAMNLDVCKIVARRQILILDRKW